MQTRRLLLLASSVATGGVHHFMHLMSVPEMPFICEESAKASVVFTSDELTSSKHLEGLAKNVAMQQSERNPVYTGRRRTSLHFPSTSLEAPSLAYNKVLNNKCLVCEQYDHCYTTDMIPELS